MDPDLNAMREAVIAGMARDLDIPEEVLRVEPSLTTEAMARMAEEWIQVTDAAMREAARVMGPGLIGSAGLDPEAYHLVWEFDGGQGGAS